MNDLSEIFEKKLNQLGIKKQVDAALICKAFDNAIMEVFGEKGQKNVKAISYKDNLLKVGVSSSTWANEVSLRRIELNKKREVRVIYQVENNI